ncbi:MAG: lipase maturation factor family protein, partial [Chloroflexi bacterium]|nr:lipase maturation factor family protein [Chloroflexota bacterium]
MNENRPSLPLLVFDGDCRFCRLWVDYWRRLTGDRVSYASFQEAGQQFPQVSPAAFQGAVQLIMPDGQVLTGAHAVFRVLAHAPGQGWLLWLYQRLWGFAALSQWVYRFVAAHRSLFYHPTRFLYGQQPQPPQYRLVCSLFLRVLGVIYLIAFISFGVQVLGLIGSEGILPAGEFLDRVHQSLGFDSYRLVPTLFWFSSSNAALMAVVAAGGVLSMLLILGFMPRLWPAPLFILYLSLVSAGQVFMAFQWDSLLLEVGFLAIFLALPGPAVVFLFRALLFRFMLLSGAVKLLSGDPTWRSLTALNFHYETQPLPLFTSWYLHQLPEWFQKASVVMVLSVELAVPFLIFAPRRMRLFAAACIAGLNLVFFFTGNFNFFNLLVLGLCLFLLDDAAVRRWLPGRITGLFRLTQIRERRLPLRNGVLALLAAFVLYMGVFQMVRTFTGSVPDPAATLMRWVQPFRVVNSYGLFANMTTSRSEIRIQGSNDGETWSDYEFKYKPGDLSRMPRWAQPH